MGRVGALLVLVCLVARIDTVPVYFGLDSASEGLVLQHGELVDGWKKALPTFDGHVLVKPVSSSFACQAFPQSRNTIVFFPASSSCSLEQQVLNAQSAEALGVLLWDADNAGLAFDPITPSRPAVYEIPPIVMSSAQGQLLDSQLQSADVMKFPIVEPEQCLVEHVAVIRAVTKTSSSVVLNGTFPGHLFACWYFRDDDSPSAFGERSCYEKSSTDKDCDVTPVAAVLRNNDELVCPLPANVDNVQQFRVVVESVFESRFSTGSLKTAHCFSHQHQSIDDWRTGDFGFVQGNLKFGCSTNCSGNGKCVGVELCECFSSWSGAACTDKSEDSDSETLAAIVVSVVLAFVLLCFVIWFVCFKRERHTLFVMHDRQDGSQPSVSRIVTTKRSFSICSRSGRDDEVYDTMQMLQARSMQDQLPTYHQTMRAWPSNHIVNVRRPSRLTTSGRVVDQDLAPETASLRSEPPTYEESEVAAAEASGHSTPVSTPVHLSPQRQQQGGHVLSSVAGHTVLVPAEAEVVDPFSRPTARGRAFVVGPVSAQPGTTTAQQQGVPNRRRFPPPPSNSIPRLSSMPRQSSNSSLPPPRRGSSSNRVAPLNVEQLQEQRLVEATIQRRAQNRQRAASDSMDRLFRPPSSRQSDPNRASDVLSRPSSAASRPSSAANAGQFMASALSLSRSSLQDLQAPTPSAATATAAAGLGTFRRSSATLEDISSSSGTDDDEDESRANSPLPILLPRSSPESPPLPYYLPTAFSSTTASNSSRNTVFSMQDSFNSTSSGGARGRSSATQMADFTLPGLVDSGGHGDNHGAVHEARTRTNHSVV